MKRFNEKGSTLVECIVAFVLFTIASLILMTGFLTSANLAAESVRVQNDNNKIINTMETAAVQTDVSVNTTASQSFVFSIGSVTYTSKGSYKTGTSEGFRLISFVTPSNVIPDTNMPVNGSWPADIKFYNSDGYPVPVVINKGTTFEYNGVYYITAQNLNIYKADATPTPTNGQWATDAFNLIKISNRAVIVWDSGDSSEFNKKYKNNLPQAGDKILSGGNYYVFGLNNQTWVDPPNISTNNWIKIT